MNLRQLANQNTQRINPNISATWQSSQGYTTDAAGKRTPNTTSQTIMINPQAVSGDTLKHIDGLNIQGVMRSVYIYGNLQGIVRADVKGGDFLIFPQVPGGNPQTWKVATVVETWPDWSHCVVVLQS